MENIFLNIGIILITGILGFIGWVIKTFVSDMKEDATLFREQLRVNSDEHRDIIVTMTKLSAHLPDIDDCEDDVAKLKRSDLKQWAKIDEHDLKIKNLYG
jgi:hypothetical protein